MKQDEFEICHHAILMKGGVRTNQVNFPSVGHFMDNFIKHGVDSVRRLKSKFYSYEKTVFWNDCIDHILAGKWVVHRFNMDKPVDIGPFWSLFKNGVNNIRVNVSSTIGD